MNIKKGDKVKMLSGKDRGKTGKVSAVLNDQSPARSGGDGRNKKTVKVVVEGLNKVKRHQRPRKQGQKGQIIEVERPVSISTVQLICSSCGKPTRVGYKKEGENKMRICKKCQAQI